MKICALLWKCVFQTTKLIFFISLYFLLLIFRLDISKLAEGLNRNKVKEKSLNSAAEEEEMDCVNPKVDGKFYKAEHSFVGQLHVKNLQLNNIESKHMLICSDSKNCNQIWESDTAAQNEHMTCELTYAQVERKEDEISVFGIPQREKNKMTFHSLVLAQETCSADEQKEIILMSNNEELENKLETEDKIKKEVKTLENDSVTGGHWENKMSVFEIPEITTHKISAIQNYEEKLCGADTLDSSLTSFCSSKMLVDTEIEVEKSKVQGFSHTEIEFLESVNKLKELEVIKSVNTKTEFEEFKIQKTVSTLTEQEKSMLTANVKIQQQDLTKLEFCDEDLKILGSENSENEVEESDDTGIEMDFTLESIHPTTEVEQFSLEKHFEDKFLRGSKMLLDTGIQVEEAQVPISAHNEIILSESVMRESTNANIEQEESKILGFHATKIKPIDSKILVFTNGSKLKMPKMLESHSSEIKLGESESTAETQQNSEIPETPNINAKLENLKLLTYADSTNIEQEDLEILASEKINIELQSPYTEVKLENSLLGYVNPVIELEESKMLRTSNEIKEEEPKLLGYDNIESQLRDSKMIASAEVELKYSESERSAEEIEAQKSKNLVEFIYTGTELKKSTLVRSITELEESKMFSPSSARIDVNDSTKISCIKEIELKKLNMLGCSKTKEKSDLGSTNAEIQQEDTNILGSGNNIKLGKSKIQGVANTETILKELLVPSANTKIELEELNSMDSNNEIVLKESSMLESVDMKTELKNTKVLEYENTEIERDDLNILTMSKIELESSKIIKCAGVCEMNQSEKTDSVQYESEMEQSMHPKISLESGKLTQFSTTNIAQDSKIQQSKSTENIHDDSKELLSTTDAINKGKKKHKNRNKKNVLDVRNMQLSCINTDINSNSQYCSIDVMPDDKKTQELCSTETVPCDDMINESNGNSVHKSKKNSRKKKRKGSKQDVTKVEASYSSEIEQDGKVNQSESSGLAQARCSTQQSSNPDVL